MRNRSLNGTIRDINRYARIIKEAYVYDEDEPQMNGQYANGEGEMPQDDEMGHAEQMMGGGEDEALKIVDQIRELALDGIQYYKDNVDDPKYEFFKKIFLDSDKALSEKDNEE